MGNCLCISGGNKLEGVIHVSGAKNSALPLMMACILNSSDTPAVIANLPNLSDVMNTAALLQSLGVKCSFDGASTVDGSAEHLVQIDATSIHNDYVDQRLAQLIRASILVLGPVLARRGTITIAKPGGCNIGKRGIDMHLDAFRRMGTQIEEEGKYIYASTNGRYLKGINVDLALPSVGATENIMTAATLAEGATVINNAAREPEIVDLANFLIAMGAKISGHGTDSITIEGVEKLVGTRHNLIGDRVEAGTYMIAAVLTKGKLHIEGVNPKHAVSLIDILKNFNVKFALTENSLTIDATEAKITNYNIITKPYPYFPTDLQAQMMTMLSFGTGDSRVEERIHDNRMHHVHELRKMGANIDLSNDNVCATVKPASLKAAEVHATDLRAAAALVLAGLAAETGTTIVREIEYLRRGYDNMTQKLRRCGADIEEY